MLSVFYLISAPRIWRHHALCDWEFDEDNGVFVEAVWRRRDAARHLLSPSAALMTDGQWLKAMVFWIIWNFWIIWRRFDSSESSCFFC